MTQETLNILIPSLAGIIAAFGIPQIIKNWKEAREMRYSKVIEKLNKAEKKIELLEQKLQAEEDELKELRMKISVLSPIIKSQNPNNKELLELVKILERNTGVNITP